MPRLQHADTRKALSFPRMGTVASRLPSHAAHPAAAASSILHRAQCRGHPWSWLMIIFVVVKLIFPWAGWRPVGSSGQCWGRCGYWPGQDQVPSLLPITGQVPTVSAPPIGPDAGSLAADWLAPVSSPHAITHLDPHFGLLALYPRLVLQRRTSFNFTKGSQALVGLTKSGDFGCICTSTSTCIHQHKIENVPC